MPGHGIQVPGEPGHANPSPVKTDHAIPGPTQTAHAGHVYPSLGESGCPTTPNRAPESSVTSTHARRERPRWVMPIRIPENLPTPAQAEQH
ncbi:hypothetical protein HZH68_002898 [Vespula germanica]|uniref:Uncharacterized protein n=1 Tax=Vespula germanica TaxID=30212 RepID=A0A834NN48_VESGE|nr:hypothetical protein HZH68_002898 [Vespula germanica]